MARPEGTCGFGGTGDRAACRKCCCPCATASLRSPHPRLTSPASISAGLPINHAAASGDRVTRFSRPPPEVNPGGSVALLLRVLLPARAVQQAPPREHATHRLSRDRSSGRHRRRWSDRSSRRSNIRRSASSRDGGGPPSREAPGCGERVAGGSLSLRASALAKRLLCSEVLMVRKEGG